MLYERFVRQLDGCTYVPGGNNCTCAACASWLYRASQGKIKRSSCTVRTQTRDRVGGTNLRQMQTIATTAGVPGKLWQPGTFAALADLIETGRFAAEVSVGYNPIANTEWDCFDGGFREGHAFYWSRTVNRGSDAHYSDPGADGRRPSIPLGFQDMPLDLLERACGALPLAPGGPTLAQEYGSGRVYALITPADPIVVLQRFRVQISGNTTTRKTPTFSAPDRTKRYRTGISVASYVVTRQKIGGEWWFQIKTTSTGKPTGYKDRWFLPNSWMKFEGPL